MRLRKARVRKLAAGTLAAVLLSSLVACTDDTAGSDQEEAPVPDVTGNPAVTLNVMAPAGPDLNLKTNTFSKLMTDKFNITFNWQVTTLDGAPSKEKRQISLASGDYPELYMLIPWVDQFTSAEMMKLSDQGVLLPLNGLIDKYAPNIKKALDENEGYSEMATSPDGKIYGLPQWVDCYHCSYQDKLWMNSAWLKKLGLTQPKTTDEMREVLRAFKTKDPNGNGKADEIPLSADTRDILIPYFMNAFIYDPQGTSGNNFSTLVLNGDKVDIQANKDGWREGLRYLKSLYDEGLIDKGAFTQNPDALLSQGDNADAVILGSATVLHPGIFVTLGQKDGRDKDYDAVPPLTGPAGANFTGYNFPSVPGATFALTNKATAEQQVQAIKMLDYIFTQEGEILGLFGKEGVGWEKPGANDKALDPATTPLYKTLTLPEGETANGYERRLFEATNLYSGKEDKAQVYPFWKVWINPEDATELASLQTNIDNYVMQNALEFITGSKDVESGWDAYVQGFSGLNLDRYLQIQQEAYDQTGKR
jgi:putative aldouronate transport system substrate-binding protein